MSKLPPALAARLAKRGLLSNNNEKNAQSSIKIEHVEEEEEVIAEDYDEIIATDNDDQTTSTNDDAKQSKQTESIKQKSIDTVVGCPNKYNIYHNCTDYCLEKYSDMGNSVPNKRTKKLFEKLLKKYPLNDCVWEQVFDPGLKTFYFWNTETDQVSWLPPSHPKAKISVSAEKLRQLLREERTVIKNETENENKSNKNDSESDNDAEDEDDCSDEESDSNSNDTNDSASDD